MIEGNVDHAPGTQGARRIGLYRPSNVCHAENLHAVHSGHHLNLDPTYDDTPWAAKGGSLACLAMPCMAARHGHVDMMQQPRM